MELGFDTASAGELCAGTSAVHRKLDFLAVGHRYEQAVRWNLSLSEDHVVVKGEFRRLPDGASGGCSSVRASAERSFHELFQAFGSHVVLRVGCGATRDRAGVAP